MQARHFAECQRPLPRAVKSLYRKRRLPGRNYSRVYHWIWQTLLRTPKGKGCTGLRNEHGLRDTTSLEQLQGKLEASTLLASSASPVTSGESNRA